MNGHVITILLDVIIPFLLALFFTGVHEAFIINLPTGRCFQLSLPANNVKIVPKLHNYCHADYSSEQSFSQPNRIHR